MEAKTKNIRLYKTSDSTSPFKQWITSLADVEGRNAINARITRVRTGNLGVHKSVGEGIVELKVGVGPGYRVYIGQHGDTLVILLCGGDKSTQKSDIKIAKTYWTQFKEKLQEDEVTNSHEQNRRDNR